MHGVIFRPDRLATVAEIVSIASAKDGDFRGTHESPVPSAKPAKLPPY